MRKWLAAFIALLVVTGFVTEISFHLMNMPRDDAYIGGIVLATAWLIVLLTVGKYVVKKIVVSLSKVKKKIDIEIQAKKEQQKANEKQNTSASNPVDPTSTNNRMHN